MSVKNNQLDVPYTPAEQAKLAGISPGAQPQPATASQAEAVAGTDNGKLMTPLRVAQAITAAGGGGGGSSTGTNIGSGIGVYASNVGATLQFKSLVAGSGVTIGLSGSTGILISASAGGLTNTDGLAEGTANLYYTDARVTANSSVVAANAKVSASGSINTHNDVAYSGPTTGQALVWNGAKWANATISGGGGEANTGTNLGSGHGVYASKSGVALQFKSLVAGTNVTISEDANTITFNAAGGGGTAYITQYLAFNSGTTVVKATGTAADIAAITATKDFTQSGICRLILNQPTTVTYQSVMATFAASETGGRTQINLELPEPLGQTNLSNAIRPIAFRLNASAGVAQTGGTIALSGTTIILSQTGYTAGAEQRMVVQF